MKFFKLLFAAIALSLVAAQAGALEIANPAWGFGGPGHGGPGSNYGYNGRWQYAGQVSAPNHGSPAVHGINYCGTESPGWCNQRGALCYTNSGYWWDNRNQCNWFNYYRCQ